MEQSEVNRLEEFFCCPVFGRCGGCQCQGVSYEEELRQKEEFLSWLLSEAGFSLGTIHPITPSPCIWHYRNRLDLRLQRRRDGAVLVGFSPTERGPVVEVEACPIAMTAISRFVPQLKREALAKLPPEYRVANLVVRSGDDGSVRWGGIGKRSNHLSESEYLFTDIAGRRVYYSLDTFFQANLSILPELRRVLRALPVWHEDATFFDLYGGVGLFGLMVSDLVSRVVDIEENVHAVRLARWNMMQNRVGNMDVLEGRVEDVLPPLLAQAGTFGNVVMVDPPRAGLSPDTIGLLNGIDRTEHLIYLSCRPESLLRDLQALAAGGWRPAAFYPFDFFPRTRHLETLVILKR